MIDGLIGGRLYGKATQRKANNGNPFVTCKVRASAGNGEPLFVNVIAFVPSVGEELLALDDGDSVSIAGALTPTVWTPKGSNPRPGLDVVAHAVQSAYHVTRKRQAATKPIATELDFE